MSEHEVRCPSCGKYWSWIEFDTGECKSCGYDALDVEEHAAAVIEAARKMGDE